jgi:hypothetical protein
MAPPDVERCVVVKALYALEYKHAYDSLMSLTADLTFALRVEK